MDTSIIDKSIKEIERYIIIAQKRLARSPEGRIRIREHKGTKEISWIHYNQQHIKTEKYLRRSEYKTISMLGGKKYCEALLPVLEKELSALKKFREQYHPEEKYRVYDQLPEELKPYVSPVAKTVDQVAAEWLQEEFPLNEYEFDSVRTYMTSKGERVRSRAEYIIADMLADAGIPYRYECRLELDSGKTVYPDFTIMHPQTGELYYIEFFGMMDDPDYAISNWEKIRKYSCDPIYSHLFMFFETNAAPFDTAEIQNLINNLLN